MSLTLLAFIEHALSHHPLELTLLGTTYWAVLSFCLAQGCVSAGADVTTIRILVASVCIVVGQVIVGVLQLASVIPRTAPGVFVAAALTAGIFWTVVRLQLRSANWETTSIMALTVLWMVGCGVILAIPVALAVAALSAT
jgi:hypothetical protein